MEFSDVVRSTFAVRDFVPSTLPDEVLYRILDQARFAPSGGNRQGWRVLVLRDPEKRRRLADFARTPMQEYIARRKAGEVPFNTVVPTQITPEQIAAVTLRFPLLDHLDDVSLIPVVLVVAVDLSRVASFDSMLSRIGVISGGSVYPFVWNILMGARNEGYGGVLTTFLSPREADVQEMLGLPAHFAIAALVPLGKPRKQLTRLTRDAVEDFTRVEHWDGPAFKP